MHPAGPDPKGKMSFLQFPPPMFSTDASQGSFDLRSFQLLSSRISFLPFPDKASLSSSPKDCRGMEGTAEIPRALVAELCSWKEWGCAARVIPVCSSHTLSWSLQSQRFGSKALGVISNPTVRAASLNCSCFSMSLAGEQGGGDRYSHGPWATFAFAAPI